MAVTNSLVKKEPSFSSFLTSDAVKNKVNQMVSGKAGNKFVTSLISLVSHNPALAECDKWTIVSAALLGESLKLSCSPQLGHFYLVPFNDKKREVKAAQFILGYKGYIQLAIRSGFYKKLNVLAIKEGELISYDPLEETIMVDLILSETKRESTPTIGYYAMFEYTNGFRKAIYWSREKMLLHADKYSSAFSKEKFEKLQKGEIPQNELWKYSSFWYKDFDEMAKKTMIRQLISKWGIMSVEFQKAYENDSAVLDKDGKAEFVTDDVTDSYKQPEQIENNKNDENAEQTHIIDNDPLNNFEE